MKSLLKSFVLIFILITVFSENIIAQCPDGDVVLSTQADVDAFIAQYPNCINIDGSLIIGDKSSPYIPSDIIDLSGLSSLKSAKYDLIIMYNPFLISLNGLQNINSLGRGLRISNNSSLLNLIGLESFKYIDGWLTISNNGFLISMNGLQNIDSIAGRLDINSNPSLINMEGLNSLQVVESFNISSNDGIKNLIGLENLLHTNSLNVTYNSNLESLIGLNNLLSSGSLAINDNKLLSLEGLRNLVSTDILNISRESNLVNLLGLRSLVDVNGKFTLNSNSLTSLDGLESLKTIVGDFTIYDNSDLESLDGIETLTYLWGNLKISSNEKLEFIEGIANLFMIGGGSIKITGNNSLSNCDVLSICSFLNSTGSAEINGNAQGCASVAQVMENCGFDCATLEVVASSEKTSCGYDDGSASAIGTGGTPPYSFEWSNGGSTQTIINLASGNYTVTVTDGMGCENQHFTTVGESTRFTIEVQTIDETFNNANDGTATIISYGAQEPITYNWNNGSTTQEIQNLSPGTYNVTVTDNSGCMNIGEAVINSYGCKCIGIHSLVVSQTCFGECDGSLEVLDISNGNPPYKYLWSTGDTLPKINSLCAGIYSLSVMDEYNCESTLEYTIYEPQEIIINIDDIVNVNGNNLGAVLVNVSGGIGEYKYFWEGTNNFRSNQEDILNLQPGCYILEVQDENNCIVSSDSICIEDITSVHSDLVSEKIYIFPNPVMDYLKVNYQKLDYNDVEYLIYNSIGNQLIKTTNSNIINTKNLLPGFYYLEFWSEKEIVTILKFSVVR